MKTVLIVTYYWPPAGGPGVQRVLKFAKYLPEFGWRPVILTVKKGEFFALDPSLEQEAQGITVYRSGILEPGNLYRKLSGMRTEDPIPVGVLEKPPTGLGQKISHAIRRNLFIPDAKIGWYPFGVHLGKKIIRREKPDLIFSSSPPPTVHLIARTLAKTFRLPFVADFRDPWTDIYYYAINPRCSLTEKLDKRLEAKVMRDASALIFISEMDKERYCSTNNQKCYYIPNGYDELDFQNITIEENPPLFIITHLGSLNFGRFPKELFDALQELKGTHPQIFNHLKIRFIGNVEAQVKSFIHHNGFDPYVEYRGYLPHNQALQIAARSNLLLLVNVKSPDSKRIVAGKTFEYLRLRKPIIAITPPDGELARLLNKFQRTYIIDFGEIELLKKALSHEFKLWKKKEHLSTNLPKPIQHFNRKYLTEKLAGIFNKMILK